MTLNQVVTQEAVAYAQEIADKGELKVIRETQKMEKIQRLNTVLQIWNHTPVPILY